MPLRPVFYRVLRDVRSGYYHEGELREHEFIVYAHEDTVRASILECGDVKRPDVAHLLGSLRPEADGLIRLPSGLARPALMPGEHVEFTRVIDLFPHTTIEAGERGVCVRFDRLTGEVSVFLEPYHVGLDDRSNTMWLIPHQTDEVLDAVRVLKRGSLELLRTVERPHAAPET